MSLRDRIPERLLWLPRDLSYGGPLQRLASWLRKWWVIVRHPHALVVFGKGTYVGPGFSLHIPAEGTFICGPRCEFRRGFRCELDPGAGVRIGAATRFTNHALIQCGTTIEIGDRCNFGQTTAIFDGNHRFRDHTRPMLEQGYDFRPIRIEDDVAVTTKCTVIADIGRQAFIGANSVVSRPIPAYTLAVGAPARAIEYYGPPGSEPEGLTAERSSR